MSKSIYINFKVSISIKWKLKRAFILEEIIIEVKRYLTSKIIKIYKTFQAVSKIQTYKMKTCHLKNLKFKRNSKNSRN